MCPGKVCMGSWAGKTHISVVSVGVHFILPHASGPLPCLGVGGSPRCVAGQGRVVLRS